MTTKGKGEKQDTLDMDMMRELYEARSEWFREEKGVVMMPWDQLKENQWTDEYRVLEFTVRRLRGKRAEVKPSVICTVCGSPIPPDEAKSCDECDRVLCDACYDGGDEIGLCLSCEAERTPGSEIEE